MNLSASARLKWAYALTVLAAVLPIGLASSGWVALTTGGSSFSAIPIVGPLVFVALGLYRVYLVARVPGTLDSVQVTGPARFLRAAGVCGLYVGAVIAVLNLFSRPLMQLLITNRSESGVEFYVVGVYLALLGGIGVLAIVLFEFSRLLAFERYSHDRDS